MSAGPGPALGIDLGGTKIEAAVLDAQGEVVWRERQPTPHALGYDAVLEALARSVARAESALGLPPASLPVGVGMPGTTGPHGRVKNANSTYLNGRAFEADLCRRLGRPVPTANDANCMALSEAVDGAGASARCVFGVILGTGVGGGLVLDGRVLQGANGLAGEWGHTPLPWPGPEEAASAPRCYCGRSGCIETWLSGPGLAADHARRHPESGQQRTAAELAQASVSGDVPAQHTLALHARRLARSLAVVIDIVDPDVIVLGGGLSRLPGLVPAVLAEWERWVFGARPDDPVRTRLAVAHHGDASGVRGAAWLASGRAAQAGLGPRPGGA